MSGTHAGQLGRIFTGFGQQTGVVLGVHLGARTAEPVVDPGGGAGRVERHFGAAQFVQRRAEFLRLTHGDPVAQVLTQLGAGFLRVNE